MRITTLLAFLLITSVCCGQTGFTFNKGGTEQVNYYASLPYENVNDKIIIKVNIKGRIYRFLMDTGAPTAISTQLFEALKPDVITKISISDINEAKDSMIVVSLQEVLIGGIAFKHIPTLVAKSNLVFECFDLDGIIGSNLMRNSILQIDESHKQLILTDDVKRLNLKAKQSSKMFLDRQSSPVIWVKLKNKKQQAKEQLLFDSGMQGLYDLSLRQLGIFQKHMLFEELGKGVGSYALGLNGMAKDTIQYRLRLPVMEMNGHSLLNVTSQTTLDNNSRIGAALLHYGIVTVDYRNKKFYFNPYSATDTDVSEKQFPINLVPRDNKLYIGTVWDQELNKRIRAGEQVIAIDGVNYEKINTCDLLLNPILKGKDRILLLTKDNSGHNIETLIERK